MLTQQLRTVNLRYRHVASAVPAELLTARVADAANPIGFLLWHLPRSQDWAVNTAIRGVPEIVRSEPWSSNVAIATPGIGTGFSSAEADAVARALDLNQLLHYADAVHLGILDWLTTITDNDLDEIPDVEANDAQFPEYQRSEFLAEMDSGPEHDAAVAERGGQPAWLFLTSVCVTHLHRHLGELDLTLGVLTGRAG